MYSLISQTDTLRVYKNSQTGTELSTVLKYTDDIGGKWWAFDNLFNIPAIRKIASQKIAALYACNLTMADLQTFITKHKQTLKAGDSDKYERAYADVLNLETLVNQTADHVKQSLALCTVYVLADDERIDAFSMDQAAQKMEVWALDIDLQAFFLNWWIDGIHPYMQLFRSNTQTASTPVLKSILEL